MVDELKGGDLSKLEQVAGMMYSLNLQINTKEEQKHFEEPQPDIALNQAQEEDAQPTKEELLEQIRKLNDTFTTST